MRRSKSNEGFNEGLGKIFGSEIKKWKNSGNRDQSDDGREPEIENPDENEPLMSEEELEFFSMFDEDEQTNRSDESNRQNNPSSVRTGENSEGRDNTPSFYDFEQQQGRLRNQNQVIQNNVGANSSRSGRVLGKEIEEIVSIMESGSVNSPVNVLHQVNRNENTNNNNNNNNLSRSLPPSVNRISSDRPSTPSPPPPFQGPFPNFDAYNRYRRQGVRFFNPDNNTSPNLRPYERSQNTNTILSSPYNTQRWNTTDTINYMNRLRRPQTTSSNAVSSSSSSQVIPETPTPIQYNSRPSEPPNIYQRQGRNQTSTTTSTRMSNNNNNSGEPPSTDDTSDSGSLFFPHPTYQRPPHQTYNPYMYRPRNRGGNAHYEQYNNSRSTTRTRWTDEEINELYRNVDNNNNSYHHGRDYHHNHSQQQQQQQQPSQMMLSHEDDNNSIMYNRELQQLHDDDLQDAEEKIVDELLERIDNLNDQHSKENQKLKYKIKDLESLLEEKEKVIQNLKSKTPKLFGMYSKNKKLHILKIKKKKKKNIQKKFEEEEEGEGEEEEITKNNNEEEDEKTLMDRLMLMDDESKLGEIEDEKFLISMRMKNVQKLDELKKQCEEVNELIRMRESEIKINQCRLCYERLRTIAYGCGHVVCEKCDDSLEERICPYCRKRIQQKIKLYIN